MKYFSRTKLVSGVLATGLLALAAGEGTAQNLSPEQIAQEAGSVKGTAAACEIDTGAYDERVRALFEHLAQSGALASQLTESFNVAARASEHQQRSDPQVGCDDFRGMFTEFLINSPDWTPARGWRGL